MVWAGYRRTGRAVYRRVTAAIMTGAGTRAMGASEGPLCARRVARAWHARGQGRRDSRARGIWIMWNEFLASGRWLEAVEGAPRSKFACGECVGATRRRGSLPSR